MTEPSRRSGGDALGGGGFAWGLFALAAFVALGLAALAISGAWAARLVTTIEPRLAGDLTVVVWGQGLESADAAAARAVESLSGQPGTTASALEPDASDAWVGALIAGGKPSNDGFRLIAVGARSRDASAPSLVERLRAAGIAAAADQHRGTGGPLERRAVLGALIVAGGGLLLCGVLVAGSLASGRVLISRRERRVALMIRLGARPRFLASLARRRAAVAATGAALVGSAVGTAVAVAALRAEFPGAPWGAGLTTLDAALVLGLVLALVLIAAAGGRLGAAAALRRAERAS